VPLPGWPAENPDGATDNGGNDGFIVKCDTNGNLQ
jgi:hypothetical protein